MGGAGVTGVCSRVHVLPYRRNKLSDIELQLHGWDIHTYPRLRLGRRPGIIDHKDFPQT